MKVEPDDIDFPNRIDIKHIASISVVLHHGRKETGGS
jgi:hypothetical protein